MGAAIVMVVVVGLVLLLGPLILLVRQREERREIAWRKFAERHRLHHGTGDGRFKVPSVFGEVGGRECTLTRAATGNAAFSQLKVELGDHLPAGLSLQKNPYGQGLGRRAFGGSQAVTTGDQAFDSEVLARADDPHGLEGWLTPRRRRAIRDLVEAGAKVEDGEIMLNNSSDLDDLEKLDVAFRKICRVAEALEGPSPGHPATDLAAAPVSDTVH